MIFILLVLALAIWWFFRGTAIRSTPEFFEQAHVRVDYKDGTVRLAGRIFPVSAVTGIRWESIANKSTAIISLRTWIRPFIKFDSSVVRARRSSFSG